VTINGQPAAGFSVGNTPMASSTLTATSSEFFNFTGRFDSVIPFQNLIADTGDSIFFQPGTTDFIILRTGLYRINYTMASVDNPAVAPGSPIQDINIQLISSLHGIISSTLVNTKGQPVNKSVTIQLQGGEILSLHAVQTEAAEILITNLEINITRLQ